MPSFEPNLWEDLAAVRREVAELHRKRDRDLPRIGDLRNVRGYGALDGYGLMYDKASGKWKPSLQPPFLKFNLTGPLSVSSSDHDPVGGAGRLILVRGRLKAVGTSTTTALLKLNSTTVSTLTFTSGNATPSYSPTVPSQAFDSDAYWWVDLTEAGTDAAGLVINGWGTAGTAVA